MFETNVAQEVTFIALCSLLHLGSPVFRGDDLICEMWEERRFYQLQLKWPTCIKLNWIVIYHF